MTSDWREALLDELATQVTVGWVGPMAQEYQKAGVPFLRSLNVRPFRIDPEDIRYISPEFHARILTADDAKDQLRDLTDLDDTVLPRPASEYQNLVEDGDDDAEGQG